MLAVAVDLRSLVALRALVVLVAVVLDELLAALPQ
jgi:hypothetical protein